MTMTRGPRTSTSQAGASGRTVSFERVDGYLPIGAYGLIGDCRSAALVGVDGSLDWLCLPRFDDDALFSRILDAGKGGSWQLHPDEPHQVHQRYRDRTNLLDTVFSTGTGVVVVTDFMPVDEHSVIQHAKPHNHPRVIRLVECLAGEMTMHHVFDPAPGFARTPVSLTASDGHLHADTSRLHLCLSSSLELEGPDDAFQLRATDAVAFALHTGPPGRCQVGQWSVERARASLRESQRYWWRWVGQVNYHGPYQQHVWRSALALKLMTYAPTGAIVAAPTTSLPEDIGGERNWDYRFTWLRDAAFTLYAFFQLGLSDEAVAYFDWLTHRHLADRRSTDMPNLFDLSGDAHAVERTLDHLQGYRGSRPVRVGNAAVNQLQLDVYGEVLDSAYVFARFGGSVISKTLWEELSSIVEMAISRWEEPDSSIWEVRSERRQYVYSKLMCWVAVDRGIRIADRYDLPYDKPAWRRARVRIHRAITSRGYSAHRRSFTQEFDSDALDASILRISQVRFLADRDPRIHSTVRAIAQHLGEGVLVNRYRINESEDGLRGEEGAFFLSSFWLVDALAHCGELEDAERRFERLLHFSSPLGLFSEEVDVRSGALLGNFPQAFTHLALVGAAVNMERARQRTLGVKGLRKH
ncbi:MAG TPA: glycoside hydrolase family 15 protein [Candidatus Saccharimonadales bacterium]|nr:glycoside hydrolase family 15 protein [Candidatus Saccharimonadales bacterium]